MDCSKGRFLRCWRRHYSRRNRSTMTSHSPMEHLDQTESHFLLPDMNNSIDAAPETPFAKCTDIDLDQNSNQGADDNPCSVSAVNPSRRDSRIKPETILARVGSFTSITGPVSLEDIFEYEWADSDSEAPNDNSKESYVVQEVLADYLKIKSFKRKYPDLSRRTMDAYERSWLQQEGLVPPGRADLGLTALRTDEVMKLLQLDYPDVHNALNDLFRRRRFQQAADLQKRQYEAARIERGEARAEAARRRALDSAADFNHRLINERLTNRRCYWDLQTMQIHLPQRVYKLLEPRHHSKGAYPVAVIPGQFAEHYEVYTPKQLMHFPLSRCLYSQPSRRHREPPPLPTDLRFGSLRPPVVSLPEPVPRSAADEIDTTDGSAACMRTTTKDFKTEDGHDTKTSLSGEPDAASVVTSGSRGTVKPCGKSSNTETVQCMICKQDAEVYLTCAECGHTGHLKCLEISEDMLSSVKSYQWSCMECKRCVECSDSGHEEQMMFCDLCDRGYHAFCVSLKKIPQGRWECPLCTGKPIALVKKRSRTRNRARTRTSKTHRSRSTSTGTRKPRKPRKSFADISLVIGNNQEAKPKRKPRKSKKKIAQDAVMADTSVSTPATVADTIDGFHPSPPPVPTPEKRKRGRPRLSDVDSSSTKRPRRPRQRKRAKPEVPDVVSDLNLRADTSSPVHHSTESRLVRSPEHRPTSSPARTPAESDAEQTSKVDTPTTEEEITTLPTLSPSYGNTAEPKELPEITHSPTG
ncbi:unnamed protein product [Dicrocoelium dendriticum]|nr:unnamed protein product [Dicrocoelium dendriticum]